MSQTSAPPGAPPHAPEPEQPSIGVRWDTPSGAKLQFLVTRTQLRGKACILCGRPGSDLVDAGFMHTDEGGWRAKSCRDGDCEVTA